MRPSLFFSAALVLAAQTASAATGTMFKCVDARGKTSYTELPCPAEAKAVRQLAVPAPESAEASTARVAYERHRRRLASDAMRPQMNARSDELDALTQYGPRPAEAASYSDDDSAGSTVRHAGRVGGQSSGSPVSSGAAVKK